MKEIKFITVEKLLELKENNIQHKLIEVLQESHFNRAHIPGAICIPFDQIGDRAEKELQKDELLVIYCANYMCRASTNAVKKLHELGFNNVLDFKGGKELWRNLDLDLEGDDV